MTFMVAFLLYNDAIQTVITLASQFGHDELKIPISQLTLAILMVQFIAFFGSMAFKWLAAAINAKRAVVVSLVIWTVVLVYIYLAVRTTLQFFVMAAVVALVLGGSQALSRSLYSQMIPQIQRGPIFQHLCSERQGDELAVPALLRSRAAIHQELQDRDSLVDHILPRRIAGAPEGGRGTGRAGCVRSEEFVNLAQKIRYGTR
jgi:UMF1 family MFS transporter